MTGPAIGLVRRTRDRLRLRDLEILTSEARSRERYKRIGLTAVSSIGARTVSLAATVVTIPLVLHYVGTVQYGLFATITSLTAFLAISNFGLSNGLVTSVSKAMGADDREAVRGYFSSAFYMLIVVATTLAIAFAAIYPVVPWSRLFNVSSPGAAALTGPAIAALVVVTLVGLPLTSVQSVQAGLQEGFLNSLWQGVGSVASLLFLIVLIAVKASLPWLVFAFAAGPVVAIASNAAVLIDRSSWLLPRLRLATLPAIKRMIRLGLMFFIISIVVAVAYQTDNIVIARVLGPAQVTQYAVPMSLFLMVPGIMSVALMPLWPAYAEALARGDLDWVRTAFIRSIAFSGTLGALISIVLLAFGVPILHLWAGRLLHPTVPLLFALSAWALIQCLTGPVAMYLNGANLLGFQATCGVVMMLANLALSIWLTRVIGVSGPAWGSVISQTVFVLLPCGIYVRVNFRSRDRKI